MSNTAYGESFFKGIDGSISYNHPARSQDWAEPSLHKTYVHGHRLQDTSAYRLRSIDKHVKAAEKVYDIPELRAAIFGQVDGHRYKEVLVSCMVLDTRGFETAYPLLYHTFPSAFDGRLAVSGISPVSQLRHTSLPATSRIFVDVL